MKSIKYEQTNYQMTERLLHTISERTSGRKDFNKLEYEVIISADQQITFYPNRHIYKNNRSEVKYTTDEMLTEILEALGNFNYYVPGRYRYCYYTTNKSRRHWIKEDSK